LAGVVNFDSLGLVPGGYVLPPAEAAAGAVAPPVEDVAAAHPPSKLAARVRIIPLRTLIVVLQLE
jgi:hypothetical protein